MTHRWWSRVSHGVAFLTRLCRDSVREAREDKISRSGANILFAAVYAIQGDERHLAASIIIPARAVHVSAARRASADVLLVVASAFAAVHASLVVGVPGQRWMHAQ